MTRTPLVFILVIVAGAASFSSAAPSATIHVPADHATIQGAIDVALAGDTVLVASGTYGETIDFLAKSIAVVGAGASTTVIDASGSPGTSAVNMGLSAGGVLQGFTVTGATGVLTGGAGIKCLGAGTAVTIVDCTITGNSTAGSSAGLGGALRIENGASVTVIDCSLSNNHATVLGGGAISCRASSSAVLDGCVISGNTSDCFGGAIFCQALSSVTLEGCVVMGNTAGCAGGAIEVDGDSSIVMTDCVLSANTAASDEGGAVHCDINSTLELTRVVVAGNQGLFTGGVVVSRASAAVVTNCTFSANVALDPNPGYAAGISTLDPLPFSGSTVDLRNCIFWGNLPAGNEINRASTTGSISASYCDIENGSIYASDLQITWPGTGNIDTDPLFIDAVGGVFGLDCVSPAIDAGDPDPMFDDPDGTRNDMGALSAVCDSDGDGLGDADEIALGTDPNDPDTDDDGLLDGTEVDVADGGGCPDPLDADSDGDTLGDGAEVALGTDPCLADSDDDGIPDAIDPLPLDPEGTAGFIEQSLRDLCDVIAAADLAVIDAKNDNARAGRRNAMCNKVNAAANATAAGDYQDAIDQLDSLHAKLDGAPQPKDWMIDSLEKDSVRGTTEAMIVLLTFLL